MTEPSETSTSSSTPLTPPVGMSPARLHAKTHVFTAQGRTWLKDWLPLTQLPADALIYVGGVERGMASVWLPDGRTGVVHQSTLFRFLDRFPCFISEQPLTEFESFMTNLSGSWVARKSLREAKVHFENGELALRAETDAMAGSSTVTAASIKLADITEIRYFPFATGRQVRLALAHSINISVGAMFAVFGGSVIYSILNDKHLFGSGYLTEILASVAGGVAAGVISFLSGLLNLKPQLSEIRVTTANNQVLAFAVSGPIQVFASVFSWNHLTIHEGSNDNTRNAS